MRCPIRLSFFLPLAILAGCGGDAAESPSGGATPSGSGASSRPSSRASSQPSAAAASFADRVRAAHGSASLYQKPPVHADLTVEFGGGTMFEGSFVFDAASGKCCMVAKGDGPTRVFDGTTAWVSGADASDPMHRFHLLTWSYFLAAPWKLADQGSTLGEERPRTLRDVPQPSAKLTFESGVGDSPEDYYVAYADPKTHALDALGYIVTYGKTTEAANEEPHAATYDAYTTVDGLQLPTELTFYNWNEKDGLVGEPIGRAMFSNLRFAAAEASTFAKPADAAEAPMPN